MNSRDAILHRIRTSLSGRAGRAAAACAGSLAAGKSRQATMAARFGEELTKVFGEVIRCDSMATAQKRLAELVETAGWASLGALDGPMTREAVAGLAPERVRWVDAAWSGTTSPSFPPG